MDGPATSQPAVQTPKSSRITQIALIVLGIILLVVISEVGYYFYTQRLGAPSPVPSPTPTEERLTTTIAPGEKALRYEKVLAFADGLERLVPKSSFFLSSTINQSIHGEVAESVFEDNTLGSLRLSYRLTLTNDSGLLFNFWLTPEETEKVTVVLKNGDVETPMGLREIREGDTILVRQEINLLADESEDKITIEVSRPTP